MRKIEECNDLSKLMAIEEVTIVLMRKMSTERWKSGEPLSSVFDYRDECLLNIGMYVHARFHPVHRLVERRLRP